MKYSLCSKSWKDGLINVEEFIQMVQFVTVAGWLETEDGEALITASSRVKSGNRRTIDHTVMCGHLCIQ